MKELDKINPSNMISEKTITFIIVNYNGAIETIECIESIKKQDCNPTSIKIIIVDNASAPDDINTIKNKYENIDWIEIIDSPENIGYFPAFNLAIEKHNKLFLSNNNTTVLCNNDLIFNSNFSSAYFAKDYTCETLVISPNVTTLDGRSQNPHVYNKFSSFRKLMLWLYFTSYPTGVLLSSISNLIKNNSKPEVLPRSQFIYAGIGACYILPPTFFKKFNKLDDRVFLGGEELILAANLIDVGGKNFYDDELCVIHAEGVSFSKKTSRWRYEQSKNSYQLYKGLL